MTISSIFKIAAMLLLASVSGENEWPGQDEGWPDHGYCDKKHNGSAFIKEENDILTSMYFRGGTDEYYK